MTYFVERQITVIIAIGKGNNGEDGFDTVTLKGYRVSAEIERAALPWMATAEVRIFGMSQSLMNQLSTLGGAPGYGGRLNTISIEAGDANSGMFEAFSGVIMNGYQDYDDAPNACFVASAAAGALDLTKPTDATTGPYAADVATLLKSLASRMTPPLNFINNGVKSQLDTPYLCGGLIDQIRDVVRHANINAEIHGGALTIWPRNGSRPGVPILVSKATGLVGYPSISGPQIFTLTTLFNPLIDFGAYINIVSSLQPACGDWYVNNLTHRLDSLTPDGAWFSDLQAASKSYILSQPEQ